ncbi:MAG TPA: hypothetical protein VMW73_13685, partial [Spirochaetia bacterium]|nr:hypothetical protein [Spirochaetia bacterium]
MTKKLALIGAVLLTMLACGSPFDGLHRNEKGAGVLVIRLGANARTVVHDFSTDIDQVDIVLTSKDGYATKNGTVVLPQTSHTFESIEAGTWDIRVTARNGEAAIGTG